MINPLRQPITDLSSFEKLLFFNIEKKKKKTLKSGVISGWTATENLDISRYMSSSWHHI